MITVCFAAAVFAPFNSDSEVSPDLFAAPARVTTVGEKKFESLLYPTPVLQDLNQDGRPEMVVGDLVGNLFRCERQKQETDLHWSELAPLQADGQPLKLDNW